MNAMKSYIFDMHVRVLTKEKYRKVCKSTCSVFSESIVSYNICEYFDGLKALFLCHWSILFWNTAKIGDWWFARIIEWKSVTDARRTRRAIRSWSSNNFEM